jgi:hypothetical protein
MAEVHEAFNTDIIALASSDLTSSRHASLANDWEISATGDTPTCKIN